MVKDLQQPENSNRKAVLERGGHEPADEMTGGMLTRKPNQKNYTCD